MINESESDKAFSQRLVSIPDLVAKVGPRYWWNEGARWFDAWLSGKVASEPRPLTIYCSRCLNEALQEVELLKKQLAAIQENMYVMLCDYPRCDRLVELKNISGDYHCTAHGTVGGRKHLLQCPQVDLNTPPIEAKRGGPCASCGALNVIKTCTFTVNSRECKGEFSLCTRCWRSGTNGEVWEKKITQQIIARLKTP